MCICRFKSSNILKTLASASTSFNITLLTLTQCLYRKRWFPKRQISKQNRYPNYSIDVYTYPDHSIKGVHWKHLKTMFSSSFLILMRTRLRTRFCLYVTLFQTSFHLSNRLMTIAIVINFPDSPHSQGVWNLPHKFHLYLIYKLLHLHSFICHLQVTSHGTIA